MPSKSASPQRQSRLYAVKSHIEGHILMLIEETNTMLNHPTAGTKSFLSQVEDNVSLLAEYKGMLSILNEDFGDK
jgi:hypothetical protein